MNFKYGICMLFILSVKTCKCLRGKAVNFSISYLRVIFIIFICFIPIKHLYVIRTMEFPDILGEGL